MRVIARFTVTTLVDRKRPRHHRDIIIVRSVRDVDARTLFADGWKAPKPCLRDVEQLP